MVVSSPFDIAITLKALKWGDFLPIFEIPNHGFALLEQIRPPLPCNSCLASKIPSLSFFIFKDGIPHHLGQIHLLSCFILLMLSCSLILPLLPFLLSCSLILTLLPFLLHCCPRGAIVLSSLDDNRRNLWRKYCPCIVILFHSWFVLYLGSQAKLFA